MARGTRTTPLADPGTLLATTHAADGDLRVRLRLARPSDGRRVHAFLSGLSGETLRRRFFTAAPGIDDGLVQRFTFFDPRQRLVVAATTFSDGSEEIVGLADAVLLETGLTELAVVVDDDAQGRGVGKLLTEVIAALALRQGATHLKAELLEHNQAMARLMERLGPTKRAFEDGYAVLYTKLPAAGRRAA